MSNILPSQEFVLTVEVTVSTTLDEQSLTDRFEEYARIVSTDIEVAIEGWTVRWLR